jgi:glycosyltransferase involved in cell wall biosynthesis
MAACDAFVLPSRSEACPIALLEAMSMGCVCIAADVGAVREMLPAELQDLVFEAGDSSQLTTKLAEARRFSASERARRGRIARQRAIGSYSVKQVAELTLQCYRSLFDAGAR